MHMLSYKRKRLLHLQQRAKFQCRLLGKWTEENPGSVEVAKVIKYRASCKTQLAIII